MYRLVLNKIKENFLTLLKRDLAYSIILFTKAKILISQPDALSALQIYPVISSHRPDVTGLDLITVNTKRYLLLRIGDFSIRLNYRFFFAKASRENRSPAELITVKHWHMQNIHL